MRIPELTTEAKDSIRSLQKQYKAATKELDRLKKIEDDAEDEACKILKLITEDGPTDHSNSFLLTETEMIQMLKKRQEIITAQGYDYPDYELVFSHSAWLRKKELEKEILNWGKKYMAKHMNMNDQEWKALASHWKHSTEFIRLTMKLAV